MRLKTNENNYIRFLKDEKFIEWKLFPTDELNEYWEKYLSQYPEEKENILLAENYFRNINLSSRQLNKSKKQEAIYRLKQSLDLYNRKRRIRTLIYTATSVVALMLTILYLQKGTIQGEAGLISSPDYIVGNERESEDILLITGNTTTAFQNNVDIHITNNNTVAIKSEDKEIREITIGQHTPNKLIVPYGKRSKIVLSDGTQVWLNSGSSLEFPATFHGDKREIFFSGEMYIEVTPDKNNPFYVQTSNYNVRVYGTKFNISSYPDTPSSVVLVEGSIGLQSVEMQELLLSPAEQGIFSEETKTFDKRKVDIHSFISWKDGYLLFDDTPITDVLKQIGRYYNFSFEFGNEVSLHGLTCTGKIILSDNLDNVMTALSLISGTKYRKEEKQIYIYKEL